MKVAVVGGGAEVVVLERDAVGQAASRGNAGWITPALCNPVPAPGVTLQALRSALRPDSPFLLRPRLDAMFASWCRRFWRSCGRRSYREGMRALLGLGARTFELYDGLAAARVPFEMHGDGLLFLSRSERALEAERRVRDELRREGYPGDPHVLTRAEAQTLEPAVGDAVAGAIHAQLERHVRPERLVAGPAAAIRRAGAEVRERTEVRGLARNGSWRLRTDDGSSRPIASPSPAAPGPAASSRARCSGAPGGGDGLLGDRGRGGEAAARAALPGRGEGRLLAVRAGSAPGVDARARRARPLARPAPPRGRGACRRRLPPDWRPVQSELEWAGLRPLPPDGLRLVGAVAGHDGLLAATATACSASRSRPHGRRSHRSCSRTGSSPSSPRSGSTAERRR